ncbi:CLUMA_CG001247, isoform A [Clunio marinus]|uniref:CLUMA_CG001247, isoform A n=1 Tax=Clunio marinus TaxID=568069 RepID=A0A1J1HLV3_9DIPT|nr:CLUMA_CG001247, isoform A [Clunio marinus]
MIIRQLSVPLVQSLSFSQSVQHSGELINNYKALMSPFHMKLFFFILVSFIFECCDGKKKETSRNSSDRKSSKRAQTDCVHFGELKAKAYEQ